MSNKLTYFENDQKAQRWICFVQGVLWVYGIRSLEDMKNDNREVKPPQTTKDYLSPETMKDIESWNYDPNDRPE